MSHQTSDRTSTGLAGVVNDVYNPNANSILSSPMVVHCEAAVIVYCVLTFLSGHRNSLTKRTSMGFMEPWYGGNRHIKFHARIHSQSQSYSGVFS